MPKITEQQSQKAYDLAKAVQKGAVKKSKALEELKENFGLSEGSAKDYIHNLGKMLEGKEYQRTLNTYATKYFLDHIAEDFGNTAFENTLSAIEKHLDYYDNLGRGRLIEIRNLLKAYKENNLSQHDVFPDEVNKGTYSEGAVKQVTVNAYERNKQARQECIKHYGCQCSVCGFDFAERYGDLGKGFIHVHHLRELSSIQDEYQINPIEDLRPVCPNCHAMLHRKTPAFRINELKRKLIQ